VKWTSVSLEFTDSYRFCREFYVFFYLTETVERNYYGWRNSFLCSPCRKGETKRLFLLRLQEILYIQFSVQTRTWITLEVFIRQHKQTIPTNIAQSTVLIVIKLYKWAHIWSKAIWIHWLWKCSLFSNSHDLQQNSLKYRCVTNKTHGNR
jgi:hypothetical protein